MLRLPEKPWVAVLQIEAPYRVVGLYADEGEAYRAAFDYGGHSVLLAVESATEAKIYAMQLSLNAKRV